MRPINVIAQKIDDTILDIYRMVVMAFLIMDQADCIKFFKEIFLMTNVSPEIVFRILFLTLNSADINFLEQKLRYRTYTTKEVFLIIKRIELVREKEFATVAFDLEYKIFVVNIFSLTSFDSGVYLFSKPLIASLILKRLL